MPTNDELQERNKRQEATIDRLEFSNARVSRHDRQIRWLCQKVKDLEARVDYLESPEYRAEILFKGQ